MKSSSKNIVAVKRPQGGVRHIAAVECIQPCDAGKSRDDVRRTAQSALAEQHHLDDLAEFFSVLANPTRLRLLLALEPKRGEPSPELCVCDLAAIAGASESMTSHQFRLLRAAGLVRVRRQGKLALYSLSDGPRRARMIAVLRSVRS